MQAIIAYVRSWVVRWTLAGVLGLTCVVVACGLLLLRAGDGSRVGAPPETQTLDVLLAEVQQLRAAAEVGPLVRDAELDVLAQRVLAEVLRLQCVCVANALAAIAGSSTDGAGGEGALAQGQAVALGWSLDAPGAVRAAGGTAGHVGVLADARWARVGIATLLVPDGVVWLVPAEGGDGAGDAAADKVNLAGYTLAVLVTQSDDLAAAVGAGGE